MRGIVCGIMGTLELQKKEGITQRNNALDKAKKAELRSVRLKYLAKMGLKVGAYNECRELTKYGLSEHELENIAYGIGEKYAENCSFTELGKLVESGFLSKTSFLKMFLGQGTDFHYDYFKDIVETGAFGVTEKEGNRAMFFTLADMALRGDKEGVKKLIKKDIANYCDVEKAYDIVEKAKQM